MGGEEGGRSSLATSIIRVLFFVSPFLLEESCAVFAAANPISQFLLCFGGFFFSLDYSSSIGYEFHTHRIHILQSSAECFLFIHRIISIKLRILVRLDRAPNSDDGSFGTKIKKNNVTRKSLHSIHRVCFGRF